MYSMFSSDIRQLNTLYRRIQFSFVFLYGRYDTGKTRLIREFCQGKETLFFSTQETVPSRQLYFFWRETLRQLRPAKEPAPFTDWKQAFDYISGFSFTHRLVLVLDEFQQLEGHCPDFAEAFCQAVKHSFPAGKIFLIVTSSSMEYAARITAEPAASPFDAVTARACMGAVPFYTCQRPLAGYSPREQLLLYGVTGGLPSRLEALELNRSADENILALFFRSGSPLCTSPLTALHRDLREVSTYNYILEIIAEGTSRLADIAARADVGTNKCAKYLNTLISMGILRKEFPAVGDIQKKVRYVFADHMLRFWYRFVYSNISGILFGQGSDIWEHQVLPHLDEYLLPIFEDVCAEYLERLASSGQTPFAYRHTGSWWCGGTRREPFFRIPLVAAEAGQAVLGTCHSARAPADISYLRDLQKPLEPLEGRKRYCCIFSTSGFTEELHQAAKETSGVWLIDLEDITNS